MNNSTVKAVLTLTILSLSGCVTDDVRPKSTMEMGTGTNTVKGASSGSVSVDSEIERCTETLGTLAIDDGRSSSWFSNFSKDTQITSLEPMIRLMVQQSNCFVVTTQGNRAIQDKLDRMDAAQASSRDYRAGTTREKGTLVNSDYYMATDVIFKEAETNKTDGKLKLPVNLPFDIGGIMNSSEATVALTIINRTSRTQLAASEGTATATDFGGALKMFSKGSSGALSSYSKTPKGKATLAAFTDAYNKLVVAVKNYKMQNVKGGLGAQGKLKAQGQ